MNTLRPRYEAHDKIAWRYLSVWPGLHWVCASVMLMAGLIAFDVAAVKLSGFNIVMAEQWKLIAINLEYVGFLCAISQVKRYAALWKAIRLRRWIVALLGIAFMQVFLAASMTLQSLAVAFNAPLVDNALINFDQSIGFHWDHLAAWYERHHDIRTISEYLYLFWGPQIIFTLVILSITNRNLDLAEFIFLFSLVTITSIAISAFFPASNPYFHYRIADPYGTTPWSQFYPLRDGTLRSVDLSFNQGLISFPSLHAAGAVLFVYAIRHIKAIFFVSVVVNILMTLAALHDGAHYLVDILAGIALSASAIGLVRWAARRKTASP
ncbi:phosphatase PAP2 family protein [Paraburkholderia bannensis]|uniref:phosphatase PAP2 family protein n=1 Tax=Paraburkholderia bannensis TaxID=765414 RepID=UPI002AB70857|nr:phosphatase PAP2 family protein [Paraburkholderia bannensis]